MLSNSAVIRVCFYTCWTAAAAAVLVLNADLFGTGRGAASVTKLIMFFFFFYFSDQIREVYTKYREHLTFDLCLRL